MPITAFYDADGNLLDTGRVPFTEAQLRRSLETLQLIDG